MSKVPVADLVRRRPGTLGLASLAAIAPPAIGYTMIVYMLSYGTTVIGFDRTTLLMLIFLSTIPWMGTIYLAALIADYVGARPVYAVGAATTAGAAFLLFVLVDTGSVVATLIAFLVTGVVQGIMAGAQGGLFTEIFETRMRYSGVSIAYQVGGMLGGAVTPIVATALYGAYAAALPIASYVSGLSVISLIAVALIRTIPADASGSVGAGRSTAAAASARDDSP